MRRQEKKATYISFIVIAVFMAIVAGVQSMRGAANGQNIDLLARVANIYPSPENAPTAAPVAATTTAIAKEGRVANATTSTTTTTKKVIANSSGTTTSVATSSPPSPPAPPPAPIVIASPTPAAPSTTALALPYSVGTFGNDFADGDGWIAWVGAMSQEGGAMKISGTASSTVGSALLSGSEAWSDYTFQATVDWNKGQEFGLIARYTDPKNFLVCQFDEPSPGTVYMAFQKHVNGVVISLAAGSVTNYEQMGGKGISAAIQVQGNNGACSFNGHQISAFNIAAAASSSPPGRIGFTTWDPRANVAEIVVRTVGVIRGAYRIGS